MDMLSLKCRLTFSIDSWICESRVQQNLEINDAPQQRWYFDREGCKARREADLALA